MSTATMHFGPEWMRTKNQPLSRSQQQPSPPPANGAPSLATYSALVSVTPVASEKLDESHPFRYSKEELLAIYQEGGGKGGLGLEVDRWEGVVREVAVEPITLREMADGEKKLFAGSLNSEIRRRPSQSTDHFSPNTSVMERARIPGSVTGSRERFGAIKRKDSTGGTADSSLTSMPRKPSLSAPQVPGLLSPTSPRTRAGYTSNFDGVLNNGESWMARRRFTEASLKVSNSSSTEIQAEDPASKPEGITEVKEEESATALHVYKEDCNFLSPPSAGINSAVSTSHSGICVTNDPVEAAENITGTGLPTTYHDYQEIGQSPVILDLAAVEWSYKDPTGQVQGPFRADLMQKWYEEGYFTPDLPMKRTHLDSQWYTVQALVSQATGASVFLTHPFPTGPPGHNQQSSLQISEYTHNEPFQPAPIRSLRTLTLESSLTGASLTSDSPSSSQLGNSSPEPSTFIGKDKRSYGTTEADGGIPAFGLQDLSTPGFIGTRLNSDGLVHGSSTSFEGQSYGTFVPDLDMGLSGHVFNNHPPMIQDSWTGFPNSSFGIKNANLSTSPPINFFNDGVARGYGFDTNHLANFGGPQSGNIVSNPGNYAPSHELAGTIPFTGLANQQPFIAQIPDFSHAQHPGQSSSLRIQESTTHVPAIHNGLPSPWSVMPDPRNHASVEVAERLEPTSLRASGGLNNVAVRGTLLGEASANGLNVGGDGQRNAPQELSQLLYKKLPVFEQDSRAACASTTTFEASASETGKSSTKTKPPLDQVPLSDNSVAQAPAKSPWTKDDDAKGKRGTTTSISLRAIQDAEARRQQTLKATEREKEKTRASITSEAKEDLQSFTTSWGLPTSQAGARSNMYLPTKDVPAASVAATQTPVSPVWTAAVKTPVVKKSMKEIQEEEVKRKTQATRDTPVSATSKKACAETTSKTTPSPILAASPNTNPWTTVGSNGKPTQPTRAPHTSFSSAVSGPSAVSRSTAPLNQRVATTPSTKMRPVIPKPGEVPEAPSHEFLKWLGESLKGLNGSANIEEIMSMLFSFPLDPDSSTLEIISDTIYANSTTLDGRRFAADFVAKRKTDAAAQSTGLADSGKTPANKPVSIADVVKAVPKSTQPEWGFKVVNKKKKGGRS